MPNRRGPGKLGEGALGKTDSVVDYDEWDSSPLQRRHGWTQMGAIGYIKPRSRRILEWYIHTVGRFVHLENTDLLSWIRSLISASAADALESAVKDKVHLQS